MGMFDYFLWPSAGISDGQTKDLDQDLIYYHLVDGRLMRGGQVEVGELPAPCADLAPTDYTRDVDVVYGADDDLRRVTVSFYRGALIDCSDLSMLSDTEMTVCRASQLSRIHDFEHRASSHAPVESRPATLTRGDKR